MIPFCWRKSFFEKSLWKDAIEVEVRGVKALLLSLEDLAVHLCTHMVVHLAYIGFEIRQLLDLVLLVEKKVILLIGKVSYIRLRHVEFINLL